MTRNQYPSVQVRQSKPRSGFTILELLVVIAVISLLVAILLPSLDAARKAGKSSTCLAHIKNIATSSRVYEADDPQGWGIPAHPLQFRKDPNDPLSRGQDPNNPTYVGAYEWGGKSGIGRPEYVPGVRPPLGSKYGTVAGFGPATRPMNDILYPSGFQDAMLARNAVGAIRDTTLDLGLFKCPSDDGPPRSAHCQDWLDNGDRSSYDHFGNSYAANIFMVGSQGGGCFVSNSPYLRPISRVPTPARTLYYEENIGRWAWAARTDQCFFLQGIDPGPTKAVRGWHGKDWTYNRAFVDAHAETQRVYEEGTDDSEGYVNHYYAEQLSSYPKFLVDCANVPISEAGSFEQYQCIIIRGRGWQKDTMPQGLIQTYLNWGGAENDRPSYEDCVKGYQ